MKNEITKFPRELGWQGRERDFKKFNEVYDQEKNDYSMFVFKDIRKFENQYNHLDTKEELVFVCEGKLGNLLDKLKIYNFDENYLMDDKGLLKLKLINKRFDKTSFIRQPNKRTIIGIFYSLTKEQFDSIPFSSSPIINEHIEFDVKLKKHISVNFNPIATNEEFNVRMKYRPIVHEELKSYVPDNVNQQAFNLAVEHQLSNLEFNFLNYFYVTNKALRNDVGQMYFDLNSKGIGWSYDRNWVKKKMKRLIELNLVEFEFRYDCRDRNYTSWYFYDSNKNLNHLTHDF